MVQPDCADCDLGRLFRATRHRTLVAVHQTTAPMPATARHFIGQNLHLSILLNADFAVCGRIHHAPMGQQHHQPNLCAGTMAIEQHFFHSVLAVFKTI